MVPFLYHANHEPRLWSLSSLWAVGGGGGGGVGNKECEWVSRELLLFW